MKYENTRIVVFKEGYYVKTKDGGKKLLHAKGSRHAMHKGIVKILQKNGAAITVSELDYKKIEEKLAKQHRENKERAFRIGG